MHAHRAAVAALLVAATATACSSSGEPKTIRATVTQTVTASPAEEAATTADGVLEMGAKKTINDTDNNVHLTVEALEYQQPYKGPQPEKPEDFQGGDIWATASIRLCNLKGPAINVSQTPWSLGYEDGTSIETTGSTGGDMPKPEFPMDKVVKAGRCAAGLVAFPVPSSKRPERVVYGPDGLDPVEWAVPKA